MSTKSLKIAIVSDLHCHSSKEIVNGNISNDVSTYLLTDSLRTPVHGHPVESLLKIIDKEEVTTDLTLCPGDFTDRASNQGLISGWGFSLEVSQKLNSEDIIATVGNHDVDVYAKNSNYSLDSVKGVKRGFPFTTNKEQLDDFWANGCTFIEKVNCRILVINSSHFHYNKESAHKGRISDDSLSYIENYLEKNIDDKIFIAMSHHPPIPHPNKNLGEDDKIVNGDELLNILGKYRCDLFIYGHKHDPFIKNHNTTNGNYNIPLFSSGSFSAGTNLMFSGVRNAFHVLELIKEKDISKGKITTWTFIPNKGWEKNYDESAFAPLAGFGSNKKCEEIFTEIKTKFDKKIKIDWSQLSHDIKDLDYLVPEESKKLDDLMRKEGWIPDKHIWQGPNHLFNTNLLE